MPAPFADLQARLDAVPPGPDRAVRVADAVLADAAERGASDAHFDPTGRGLAVRYRLDGVIVPAADLPRDLAPNVVARLKVMAELLTYRTDVPQEGAVRGGAPGAPERRVSTFPTVHGEKAVVRLFDPARARLDLDRLGLPADVLGPLAGLLRERGGAVFLTGPSGSGKTTTIYACLRRIVADGSGRHVVTIEDPVEQLVEGVSQSQARPGTEFDFARGLRSLLRQDPDVIMVGEIRDPETAAAAVEAALTGHLVFSTLHTGSACGVVGRLLDMGVEPYLLTSGVKGVVNQRLLRRACGACRAAGCPACGGTGYRGRFLIAELLVPTAELRRAILARADTDELDAVAARTGWRTLRTVANDAVAAGHTTAAEVDRVLGPDPGETNR